MAKRKETDLGDALPAMVSRLVESYESDGRTHRIDQQFLPSRQATIEVCNLLLELTFPGYFGRRNLSKNNISYHVGELLPKLFDMLSHEIEQCLCFDLETHGHEDCDREPCCKKAERIARDFIEQIPSVREVLADDVQAAYDGDPAATTTAETILAYPAILAITIYRYAHVLYKIDVPMMPRIMTERAHLLTGIDIHPGATIGRRFFIDHGTGVVIGETAVLGDNVKLYQGVTIGALSFPKDERGRLIRGQKRHPTIGNNVTIYANAIVLGGNTEIQDGAIVGGSVFLTQSVEAGHQVSITPPVLRFRPPRGEAK